RQYSYPAPESMPLPSSSARYLLGYRGYIQVIMSQPFLQLYHHYVRARPVGASALQRLHVRYQSVWQGATILTTNVLHPRYIKVRYGHAAFLMTEQYSLALANLPA